MESQFPENQNQPIPINNVGEQDQAASRLSEEIPRENRFLAFLKHVLLFVVLFCVIVASFWVSFRLGKRILVPAKNKTDKKIEVAVPKPPPAIAKLNKLEDLKSIVVDEEVAELVEEEVVEEEKVAEVVVAKPEPKPKPMPKPRPKPKPEIADSTEFYKVQAGIFALREGAMELFKKLDANGFEALVIKTSRGWRVQAGAFRSQSYAKDLQSSLKAKGFDSVLIHE